MFSYGNIFKGFHLYLDLGHPSSLEIIVRSSVRVVWSMSFNCNSEMYIFDLGGLHILKHMSLKCTKSYSTPDPKDGVSLQCTDD